MTNDDLNKFRGIVKEEINSALEVALKPIKATLDKHEEKLDKLTEKVDVLWEQTAKLSVDVTEIKDTLNSQVLVSNKNNADIKKVDKRVTSLEDHLGLPVLPELAIIS